MPGVSGGTVAFIVGIYEVLIDAITAVNARFVRRLLTLQWRAAFADFPWQFLLALGLGLGTAILSMAHVLTWALANYETYVWGFFFGLIVASIILVLKRVRRWILSYPGCFDRVHRGHGLAGGCDSPRDAAYADLPVFSSGAGAICAMILPGI